MNQKQTSEVEHPCPLVCFFSILVAEVRFLAIQQSNAMPLIEA